MRPPVLPKSFAAPLGALLVVACHDPLAVDAGTVERGTVAGRYVVSLRATPEGAPTGAHDGIRAAMARTHGRLRHEYVSGAYRGFAADLSAADVEALRASPDVVDVEPDREIHGAGLQLSPGWGLDRVDQTSLPLGGTYVYAGTGAGVTVFVFDTGLNYGHAEFGGRAAPGADYVGTGAADCNGHGSHVAGIVGGATRGVAKGVRLVSVRVLDCAMKGTTSEAILALGWVADQKRAHPSTPMVANLSLEGESASAAFDRAVSALATAGVTVVVAAGNSSVDACTVSPARAPGALAVAATDASDGFAAFANRGSCVALAAPGVGIESAWIGSDRATQWASGTSASAPFVAGAAALYLERHPAASPAEVRAALVDHAVAGQLLRVPPGTANRLLSVSFLTAAADGLLAPRPLTQPRDGRPVPTRAGAGITTGG